MSCLGVHYVLEQSPKTKIDLNVVEHTYSNSLHLFGLILKAHLVHRTTDPCISHAKPGVMQRCRDCYEEQFSQFLLCL